MYLLICFSVYRCPVIWRPWTLTISDTQPKKVKKKKSLQCLEIIMYIAVIDLSALQCFLFLFFIHIESCWIQAGV